MDGLLYQTPNAATRRETKVVDERKLKKDRARALRFPFEKALLELAMYIYIYVYSCYTCGYN